jgi:protein-S-isoprenylcysteine O-methyltransferase Ste14
MANWLTKRQGPANDNAYRLISAFGALLLTLAAVLRTWGTAYLQAEIMRDSRVHTEKLLADGPFRYVRNPLYLANILMAAGVGLMASRIGSIILFAGRTAFVIRLLLREESELLRATRASRIDRIVPQCLASCLRLSRACRRREILPIGRRPSAPSCCIGGWLLPCGPARSL